MKRPSQFMPPLFASLLCAPLLFAQSGLPGDGRGGGGTPPPPPGRPPEGALTRSNPKTYELTWDVLINVVPTTKGTSNPLQLDDANFLFPVIPLSTWSQSDLDAMRVQLKASPNSAVTTPATRIDRTAADGVAVAIVPMGPVNAQILRCWLTQTVTVWRSDLDDVAACKVPWPAEWPPEARAWLAPDWFIESDDQRFSAFVERVSQGKLRHTPVFVAAKELIRATIGVFRGIDGAGIASNTQNQVHGLRLDGAALAMQNERGTAVDLALACVAVLRSAGIPARPVIGVDEAPAGSSRNVRTTYTVWAEFFLPGSGWVPFDPMMMRGSHAMNAVPERSWTGLGRIKDLNLRVPIAYSLRPRRPDALTMQYPGAWAWSARGQVNGGVAQVFIQFTKVTKAIGPTPS